MNGEELEYPGFIERLRLMDSQAWHLAYEPLYQVALGVVLKTLWNSIDHDVENLACDIVAEFTGTFLAKRNEKLNSATGFRDLKNVTAHLAKNRTIDYLRKVKCRPQIDGSLDVAETAAEVQNPSNGILEVVFSCVAKLPEPFRQMFSDHVIDDVPVTELATTSKINYNTVCTYLAKATRLVKACVVKHGAQL